MNRALLFSKPVFAKVIEPKIERILDGLQFILEQKHVLGLKEGVQNRPLSRRLLATYVVEESGVYGRNVEKEWECC
ncbi:hypothetical protein L484_027696 [Morus notabilis]|uniref:Uncharacterized protein n=1 Tax=Morus notabilis TaxID=981085 RepID=W9RKL7_9ROSA|nr:hypothetical protein L484_027696 [Morus notabilis]